MTFYWIYEVAFPVGFGLVAVVCIAFALAGMLLRRPLVYSSRIPLFCVFAFLTPMFLISLRHIVAPPFFSGYGIYLNSVLVAVYPILAYYALVFSRGFTVLGMSPRTVRQEVRGLGDLRVVGFRGMAMSLVIPRGKEKLTRQALAGALGSAASAAPVLRPLLFIPTLMLGLIMAGGGYWSWCEATQCSEAVSAFSAFMTSLRP